MVTIVVLLAAAVSPFCENSGTEESMKAQKMETIGGRLKYLRENEELTQKELEFEFGI